MSKIYKKSKLSYEHGLVIKGDKIINIDSTIVDLCNKVERDYQYARWQEEQQEKFEAVPEPEKFRRLSEGSYPVVSVDTPAIDEMTENAIALMNDYDNVQTAEKINSYLKEIAPLVQWVNEDFVVKCHQDKQTRFDLPVLGNPLEWTIEFLVDKVTEMIVKCNG